MAGSFISGGRKMEPEILEEVTKLVQKAKIVYVSTANKEGIPHIAVEEGMVFLDRDRVLFEGLVLLREYWRT